MGALLLVRHGQASFGASDYDALSSVGFEQARTLGAALRPRKPPTLAFRGTMRRHRETAEACLAAQGANVELVEDAGFDEYDHEEMLLRLRPEFADMKALLAAAALVPEPRRAFQQTFRDAMARWASGEHDAEYREPFGAFVARAASALARAIERVGPSGHGIVFTSGGPIAVVVQQLLHVPTSEVHRLAWGIANCSITRVVFGERGRHLSTFNEYGHFEGENASLLTFR